MLLFYLRWAGSNDAPKIDENYPRVFSYGRTASCAVCGIKTRHSAKPLPVPSTGTANIATKTGPINPAVHLSPVLPVRTQKVQGPLFTDGSLPTSVHLCLSKPGQAANLQEEDEWTQHKALEKLSNERSLWEINCRLWGWLQRGLAEAGMMTCNPAAPVGDLAGEPAPSVQGGQAPASSSRLIN